jgi:hypothetical protein
MILCLGNFKATTENLSELINEFSKHSEYNINTQKYTALPYANNKLLEIKIKKAIPFTIAIKKTAKNKFNWK